MVEYQYIEALDFLTPIGGNLNGKYIKFDDLPESVKIIISNPKYVVLVRENTIPNTPGGGRTSGTMWHNKQVLGFTVEDAIRSKKIAGQTAIPDTLEDPSKFNGVPANVYNIVLTTSTGKEFIRESFYNGTGMRVGSKSDPTGYKIFERDVYTSDSFATDRGPVAFDVVFIHQGTSEKSSAGCIIFSKTRNEDKTIKNDVDGVKKLNKYLQSVGLVGPGKLQQFAIINLWELPPPPQAVSPPITVIDNTTNQPIQKLEIKKVQPISTPLNP